MEQINIFNSNFDWSSENEDSIPLTQASLPNVIGFKISCKLLETVKV